MEQTTETRKTRKTIPVLPPNSTKDEEIAFLEAVADSIHPDTYLTSFFTKNLIGWLKFQIKSDFVPDLYTFYTEQAQELEDARKDIATFETTLKEQRTSWELTLAGVTEEWKAKSLALTTEKNMLRESLADAQKNGSEWFDKWAAEHTRANETAKQVTELKAELYDCYQAIRKLSEPKETK